MTKPFMDVHFLLNSHTARLLYHDYAAPLPIIDYHCHINPREIADNLHFSNLTEAWLTGDHYKWRAMRAHGVPEQLVTGEGDPYDKFEAWAATLPLLIGNPLYHWTHMELKRYFGITEPLGPGSCLEIWEATQEHLKHLSVREIIRCSNVETICTTDDPADDLEVHRQLQQDAASPCAVFPAFRPDQALQADKPGYLDYLGQLGRASGLDITSLDLLKAALTKRLDAFWARGCSAADHGLDRMVTDTGADPEAAFEKALQGHDISPQEADALQFHLLCFLAPAYRARGMVMQLHVGAVRNNNPVAFKALGPDTGFDAIRGTAGVGEKLGALLGRMEARGGLPKTILYSLNPADNPQVAAMAGCFQDATHPGKIQHGSAWWFNDSKTGMRDQIINLANHSVLGHFIGMTTDSRSFLSYTRHEYFRRILCDIIGTWVENGEYPADIPLLGRMVEDISYYNTKRYFRF
ncbi:MAG: glucuronate isomerase [Clostridiales bacterium]|nr:glucuronate isomerase [Clostridiales bacterium]